MDACHITIRVYHEGEASEELRQDLDAATTEVYADFAADTEGVSVDLEFARADGSEPILVRGRPVFVRKGTGAYGSEHAHLYRG